MAIRLQKKPYTLVFVINESERKVLLGMKKRGFGANLYNGFGGKLEPGETVEQAAYRELEEESNVKALNLTKVGINMFSFGNDPVILEVHVFYATHYEGTPSETEEMRPEWFSFDNIPFDQMWQDDRHWLPFVFEDKRFVGEFHFSGDQKELLDQDLEFLQEAPREFDLSQKKLHA